MAKLLSRNLVVILSALALALGILLSGSAAQAKPDKVKEPRPLNVKINVQGKDSENPRINLHAHKLLAGDVLTLVAVGEDGSETPVTSTECAAKVSDDDVKADRKKAKPCKARIREAVEAGDYYGVVTRGDEVVGTSRTVTVPVFVPETDDEDDASDDDTTGEDTPGEDTPEEPVTDQPETPVTE